MSARLPTQSRIAEVDRVGKIAPICAMSERLAGDFAHPTKLAEIPDIELQ
jgi:hypothetical protein